MTVQTQDWYDLNETRRWPFDDAATLLDDTGQRISDGLLADLNIRFPGLAGDRAYVSAIAVSTQIVTLTISSTAGMPLAAVSVRKPLDAYRHYAVSPLYDGVGGWVVFGSNTDKVDSVSHRFSSATQSLLLAKAARRYFPELPVVDVGRVYTAGALSGLVRLQGGSDIEIVGEEREIAGTVRRVGVVRLKDKQGTDEQRNVLELYAGPCGQRPESGNCGDPPPIEVINTVAPDCCGNVFVELRGCGEISQIVGQCGIVIDCDFGLSEACVTPDRLPDSSGRLPNEYDDQCETFSESISLPADDTVTYVYAFKQKLFVGSGLPYEENFQSYVAAQMTVVSGEFVFTNGSCGRGAVSSITQHGVSGNTLVQLSEPPRALPAAIRIFDSPVTAYNTVHTVTAGVTSSSVATNRLYTSDATGGLWEEVAAEGAGTTGVVWETQQDTDNIALWTDGLVQQEDWDCVWKKFSTALVMKIGSQGAKSNGGIVFNYQVSDGLPTFWLALLNWDGTKAVSLLHYNNGHWQIKSTLALPALDLEKRYRLEVTVLPLDEDAESPHAVATVVVDGLDDSTAAELSSVVLHNYYPATGQVGLYSFRSLTWFEYFRVEDFSP